ncbi:acetylcholinesterase-like [Centruroides vittatus]|uniref:acetylcholinesterase-like n=1 Tax=Centruroides vittatus TaxID=120091 RepID=UPI00350EE3BF
MFKCPTNFLAEKFAGSRFNVFHYTFKHRSSTNIFANWTGVPHFEEVHFIFGVPLLKTDEEQEFNRNVIKLRTSFTKTGTPQPTNKLERWLPYTNQELNSIELQARNVKVTKLIPNEHCVFWRNHFNNYSSRGAKWKNGIYYIRNFSR